MSTLTEEHISFCEEQMKNFSLGATKSSSSWFFLIKSWQGAGYNIQW
jgi:hypothetical protein